MGRRGKERIARILAGEEAPRRNTPVEPIPLFQCKDCGGIFPFYSAEDHFKRCKGKTQ